jgi:hypothetical protein
MSTRAFAATLIGATFIATMMASQSYLLGLLLLIVGVVLLLLRWTGLSVKRRIACTLAVLFFAMSWQHYATENKRIAEVKNLVCPASPRHTIGKVLDTVCKRRNWKCFENRADDGNYTVQFTGRTKKGEILLQFGLVGDKPSGKPPYAEFNGEKMSLLEVASFFNQADAEYTKKRGE